MRRRRSSSSDFRVASVALGRDGSALCYAPVLWHTQNIAIYVSQSESGNFSGACVLLHPSRRTAQDVAEKDNMGWERREPFRLRTT